MTITSMLTLSLLTVTFASTVWVLAWRAQGRSVPTGNVRMAQTGAAIVSLGFGLMAASGVVDTPSWRMAPSALWIAVATVTAGAAVLLAAWVVPGRLDWRRGTTDRQASL